MKSATSLINCSLTSCRFLDVKPGEREREREREREGGGGGEREGREGGAQGRLKLNTLTTTLVMYLSNGIYGSFTFIPF